MKKLISLTLILTFILALIAVSPAMATMYIGRHNNTVYFESNFEDIPSGGVEGNSVTADKFVIMPNALTDTNTALKMSFDSDTGDLTRWRPQVTGERTAPFVSGANSVIEFNLMVDSSSDEASEPCILDLVTGAKAYARNPQAPDPWANTAVQGTDYELTDFLAKLSYNDVSGKWELSFSKQEDGGSEKVKTFVKLCELDADKWYRVVCIFNLAEGKFGATCDGQVLSDLAIFKKGGTAEELVKLSGLLDINLYNQADCYEDESVRKASTYYIDDIKAYKTPELTFAEGFAIDSDGVKISDSSKAMAADTLVIKLSNEIAKTELTLNGSAVSKDSFVEIDRTTVIEKASLKADGTVTCDMEKVIDVTYAYLPKETLAPLNWDDEYTLSGSVTDIYGNTKEIEDYSFATVPQPDNLIQITGFYDESGKKLDNLTNGEITAKIRFWQKAQSPYTYMLLLTKGIEGIPLMTDIKAGEATLSGGAGYTEKEIKINVSDCTDSTLSLLAWDNLSGRNPYSDNCFYGKKVLTAPVAE